MECSTLRLAWILPLGFLSLKGDLEGSCPYQPSWGNKMKERIILLHEYLVWLVSATELSNEEEETAMECIGDCEFLLFYGNWPRALLSA